MIPHPYLHQLTDSTVADPERARARHEALQRRSERVAARPNRLRSVAIAVLDELKRLHNQSSAEWAQSMEQRGH